MCRLSHRSKQEAFQILQRLIQRMKVHFWSKKKEKSPARLLLEAGFVVLKLEPQGSETEGEGEVEAESFYFHIGYINFKTWRMAWSQLVERDFAEDEKHLVTQRPGILHLQHVRCLEGQDRRINPDTWFSMPLETLPFCLNFGIKYQASYHRLLDDDVLLPNEEMKPGYVEIQKLEDVPAEVLWLGSEAEAAVRGQTKINKTTKTKAQKTEEKKYNDAEGGPFVDMTSSENDDEEQESEDAMRGQKTKTRAKRKKVPPENLVMECDFEDENASGPFLDMSALAHSEDDEEKHDNADSDSSSSSSSSSSSESSSDSESQASEDADADLLGYLSDQEGDEKDAVEALAAEWDGLEKDSERKEQLDQPEDGQPSEPANEDPPAGPESANDNADENDAVGDSDDDGEEGGGDRAMLRDLGIPFARRPGVYEQRFVIEGIGELRYNSTSSFLRAHCDNPDHGSFCHRRRTCTGSNGRGEKASGQGRPIGSLVAWLLKKDSCETRESHMAMGVQPYDSRVAARQLFLRQANADSFSNSAERPQRSNEGPEPRMIP